MVLTDLMYHGWTDSAGPVVEALAQVRKVKGAADGGMYSSTQAQAIAMQTLRNTSAYKQAQPKRKQYLEQNLRDWMFELSN